MGYLHRNLDLIAASRPEIPKVAGKKFAVT
jgi:hypothetical protein